MILCISHTYSIASLVKSLRPAASPSIWECVRNADAQAPLRPNNSEPPFSDSYMH